MELFRESVAAEYQRTEPRAVARGPALAFAWQAGYGVFSASHSHIEAVKEYIAGQEEHHRKVSFQDELLSFLRKQGIEFDERYIWK